MFSATPSGAWTPAVIAGDTLGPDPSWFDDMNPPQGLDERDAHLQAFEAIRALAPAVVVPNGAIVTTGAQSHVFVETQPGVLTKTPVTLVARGRSVSHIGQGLSDTARYMLVAGAVAGGGLTVVANAPNPAGVALLRSGFQDASVGALGLLLGALAPTLVATFFFLAL